MVITRFRLLQDALQFQQKVALYRIIANVDNGFVLRINAHATQAKKKNIWNINHFDYNIKNSIHLKGPGSSRVV